jgi:hypothetical protein
MITVNRAPLATKKMLEIEVSQETMKMCGVATDLRSGVRLLSPTANVRRRQSCCEYNSVFTGIDGLSPYSRASCMVASMPRRTGLVIDAA